MSAPKVDVLAVLDAEIRAREFGPSGHAAGCVEHPPGFSTRCNCHGPELREARAAVAELIKAAEAMRAMYEQANASGDWGNWNLDEDAEYVALRAALARIGGAS